MVGAFNPVGMNGKYLKRKIERNLRDYGLLLTLIKGIAYLCRLVFEHKRYLVYKVDLDRLPMLQTLSSQFVFRLLEPQEMGVIGQIEEMEEWLESRLEEKLRGNSFCMVVMDGKKVAGFNLVTMNEVHIPLLNLKRNLHKDSAWSEQITVHSDYRKNGLGTELRCRVCAELKTRGIRKFYGGTLVCNRASLMLAKRAGFNFLAHITYKRFLSFNHWVYRRARV